MTPSKLMALAKKLDRGEVDYHGEQAAALRSYAELVSALEYLHADKRVRSKYATADVLNLAQSLGWPGLEEAWLR